MSSFLCLLVYWVFPYFFYLKFSSPWIPWKEVYLDQPQKIFLKFNFNLFVYYNSSFSHWSRQKKELHRKNTRKNTYLCRKNSALLVRHLSQHVLPLHLTICNMYWDCMCFAFHSSPSIKIVGSRMFSGGEKYSATTR